MRNVTITLENDVAKWARVWAAKRDTSVSRLLGNVLKEKMEQEQGYELAMQKYLSHSPTALKKPEDQYPNRASLHER
jgi:hypothetical protein